jgi:hypothetical protein
MYILANVQKTQPDTSTAETDTLLQLHFILPSVISSQKKLPMREETKISTCGCIIKHKALYFKLKCMGKCTHNSHLSSTHKQTKNCFNGTEKQKKTIIDDTTYSNIP